MATVRTILRRRRDARDRRQSSVQNRTQRIALGVGSALSILLAVLFLLSALFFADLTHDLP